MDDEEKDVSVQEIRVNKLTAENDDFTVEFHVDKIQLKIKVSKQEEWLHHMHIRGLDIPEKVWLEVELPTDSQYATLTMKEKK